MLQQAGRGRAWVRGWVRTWVRDWSIKVRNGSLALDAEAPGASARLRLEPIEGALDGAGLGVSPGHRPPPACAAT